MVYCGKPSQGCSRCRQRRLKCDQQPSGCGQCSRKFFLCPGYRNQLDLIFRDQSEETARKVRTSAERGLNREREGFHRWRAFKHADNPHYQHTEVLHHGNTGRLLNKSQFVSDPGLTDPGRLISLSIDSFDVDARSYTPRLDIIDTYPEADRTRVVQCLNYYVKFAGPNYIWRKEVVTTGSIEVFSRYFLQASLAEPVFLETVLAICQADLDMRVQPNTPPSRAALQHHSRALELLRSRISTTAAQNDAVLLATMVAMIVYSMTSGDWTSFGIHLGNLRRAMRSKGLKSFPDWQGWLTYAYAWSELRWANYLVHQATVKYADVFANRQAVCTMHAVSTTSCSWIEAVPPGFQRVARSAQLGARFGKLLGHVAVWLMQLKAIDPIVTSLGDLNVRGLVLAGKCSNLITSPHAGVAERMVCIAVIAYVTSLIEGQAGHSRGLEDLTVSLHLLDLGSLDEDCAIWVAISLAAANETFPHPLPNRWTFLDRVLASQTSRYAWPEIEMLLRRFFWAESHATKWKDCWFTALFRQNTGTALSPEGCHTPLRL